MGEDSPPPQGEVAAQPTEGPADAARRKARPVLAASGRAIRTARRLRREMTLPERMLWVRLRGRKGGERWRKQHPCGEYDLDFFQPAAALAIEVDGIAHDMGDRPTRDQRRDRWLIAQGITVQRIAAADVVRDADAVADAVHRLAAAIRAARGPSVALRAPPPRSGEERASPPPQGEVAAQPTEGPAAGRKVP